MAKSQPRKNQSECSDLPQDYHIIIWNTLNLLLLDWSCGSSKRKNFDLWIGSRKILTFHLLNNTLVEIKPVLKTK